jgi:hypothetical protein
MSRRCEVGSRRLGKRNEQGGDYRFGFCRPRVGDQLRPRGHDVTLWDQDPQAPERTLGYIGRLIPDLEANGLLNGATAQTVGARMRPVSTLEAALDGAIYVQENTPEDVDVKRKVFARLDASAARDAALASSTSAILPSAFHEALKGRARCLVVHPINPPYLIPAAEVVPAPWTDAGTVERASSLLRAAGHAPIVMKREIDGFVMNRLRGALLEGAFRLVAEGYATSRTSTLESGAASHCAGRSSVRSKPSISARQAGFATTPSATRGFIPASSPRCSGASTGPARL